MANDAQMPERIWLIPNAGNDGETVWCDNPAPGVGMEASDAVEYSRSDICASGQQVRALELRLRDWQGRAETAWRALEAVLSGEPVRNADEIVSFCKTAALTPVPQPTCRKCGGTMQPGHAIAQTYTSGAPDDLGGDAQTMSAGGPGALIDCRKCEDCGWSVTADPQPEAATPTAQEAVEKAFRLIFEAYSMPADRFAQDSDCISFLNGKVTKAFSILQTLYAHQPSPVCRSPNAVAATEAVLICAQEMCRAGHPVSALNVATDALRALKGGDA